MLTKYIFHLANHETAYVCSTSLNQALADTRKENWDIESIEVAESEITSFWQMGWDIPVTKTKIPVTKAKLCS